MYFLLKKYIKIIFFYSLKIIFEINLKIFNQKKINFFKKTSWPTFPNVIVNLCFCGRFYEFLNFLWKITIAVVVIRLHAAALPSVTPLHVVTISSNCMAHIFTFSCLVLANTSYPTAQTFYRLPTNHLIAWPHKKNKKTKNFFFLSQQLHSRSWKLNLFYIFIFIFKI
jgi:hypothetical protein